MTRAAGWTSCNNAIFLCLNCAGKHRGLGVHKSFVKSVLLDNWTDAQTRIMKTGGNLRLKAFILEYQIKDEFPLNMKFGFLALYYYKVMVALY